MRYLLLLIIYGILCISQSLSAYDLGVVSLFRNTAPYIKEWVEYHRMVGVDHFWLYNDESSDNWEEVLNPYIEEGLVEVIYWPADRLKEKSWVRRQTEAVKDALYRSRLSTKWLAHIDTDEFLLPMQDKTVTECLNKHFSSAKAIYVSWRNFGTNHVRLEKGEFMLNRLTACSLKSHSRNCVGKSIVRPIHVKINEVHYAHHFVLLPGASYVNGDGKKTLKRAGLDWKTDGKAYEAYLRLNHYALRDEGYFWDTRLPRDSNPNLVLQLYDDYNLEKDDKILSFIQKMHPEMYEKFWSK